MWNIYQLINSSTGEVVQYEPALADEVAEIVNARTRAAEAVRLTTVRERLAGLLPMTAPRQPNGDSLAVSLFAQAKGDES